MIKSNMINLKKIEQKFPETKEIKSKSAFINTRCSINLDFNISETDSNVYSKTIEKSDFISPKKKKYSRGNTYKLFKDNNSVTTNYSEDKSIKKVTFSTVEIIRIKKYKKFNAKNNFSEFDIQKNIVEVKNEKKKENELDFCSIF